MPWVHPFTSVTAGPTGSGQSMLVRWFVHNIKHMMTPKPDRIFRCYGEYQTLYGTVKGIEFQQGLPDLDNLDPREKHLIILDDLTAGCQISTLIFDFFLWRGGLYKYSMTNILRTAKFLTTWSLSQRYCPRL
jgi:hypothetical protein